jgi:hypothetical protein
VQCPWFDIDREFHKVDNNQTKTHKYLKKIETFHVRPMSKSNQCLYDTVFHRFRELRRNFKGLHRLQCAQYIVRIEGGLKNNPRIFFKYADMKRCASGYPWSIFLGSDCARDSHSIANLFAGFFQSVYVQDYWIPDSNLPTPDDSHKKCPQLKSFSDGLRCQQGTRPRRN